MKRILRVVLAALIGVAIVANAGLLAGIQLTREPAPKPLTGERIEKASLPAIVLIQSNYVVSTSVPETVISADAQNRIEQQIVAMYYAGQISNSRADIDRAYVQIVTSNPDLYYSVGPNYTYTFNMWATGSGFFVTEDGYLVTAAHVVSANKTEIHDEVIAETKGANFVANTHDQIKRDWSDFPITDAQINSLVDFYQRWLARYFSVDKIDSKYYLGTGTVQAGDSLTGSGARASVVSIDPTVGGHDIAILKAQLAGVPTLPLAAGNPHLGEATYAIGYPRQGYLQEDVPLNQSVAPTTTSGQVLTVSQQKSGWTAWGTNAKFTHGASGGPVVGPNGDVLGIVSYSTVDAQGNQLPGQGYFVPTQYIKEDLASDSVKVNTDPKNLTSNYYRALADGDIQRYKPELVLLQDIQAKSAWDAYIKDDVISTEGQILAGNDKTPPDLTGYVPAAAVSSGGLILLTLLVWLGLAIAGRRRKPALAAEAAAEAATEPAIEAPAEASTETPPEAPAAPTPVTAGDGSSEPAAEVVSSPQEVLRETEPVVQLPADAPARDPEPEPAPSTPPDAPSA